MYCCWLWVDNDFMRMLSAAARGETSGARESHSARDGGEVERAALNGQRQQDLRQSQPPQLVDEDGTVIEL